MSEAELELVRAALTGDRGAIRRLVGRLRPLVHTEVAHLLLRRTAASGRNARQDLEDLVQEVFARLWADDGKLLRRWDPVRGRSLDSWVRLVARSRVLDQLRSPRRNPAHGESLEDPEIDRAVSIDAPSLAATIGAREDLERIQAHLREQLSERDWMLFIALFAEGCGVQQVSEEVGMTTAAVYQWKSRVARHHLPPLAEALREEPT
jgi:RNA polymerase sigma factor (sigma-70 family)